MSDLGFITLSLAFLISIYSVVAFIIGRVKGYPVLIASASKAVFINLGLTSIAVTILLLALITHNFQIEYVASYSSRDSSLPYLISALWAGNKGSLLFWAWLLSLFAAITALQRKGLNKLLLPYALVVTMFTEAFFLLLLIFLANPFHSLSMIPADGMGLNPILENPGMIFHPPILLAGYVALTIPFAFAIAALITGKLQGQWIEHIRPWVLISWILLGIGNLIGMWWAYVELGWGGYWAWDPVENAGLMPWLITTAFLHSTMIQRRRKMFKLWNMILIILAFCLVIFGTYLTRSNILSSVHTFSDTGLGPFFLTFLGISILGSLGLINYRYSMLKGDGDVESVVSREGTFLLNNILLIGATLAIIIGTIFPAISEMIGHIKVTVGASFFNTLNGPIFLAIVLLIGLCTLIGWRKIAIKELGNKCLLPFILALIVTIILVFMGLREWYSLTAFFFCIFVISAVFYEWFREIKARHVIKKENYFNAFLNLVGINRSRYGAYIIHIAIVLITIGVVGSSFYNVQKEGRLTPGSSMILNNYTVTYEGTKYDETESKSVLKATLSISDSGKAIGKLYPEKYFHRNYEQSVTEVAIHSTIMDDLYVILASSNEDGSAVFKILVNPMVSWIWIGAVFLLIGGLIILWPSRRYQRAGGEVEEVKEVQDTINDTELDLEIEKQVLEVRRRKSKREN